jgi:5-methylcytosine-specific restriction endonuclease McrA
MEIIDRATAKETGLSTYFTGRPCKHDHISERFVLNGVCCECKSAYNSSTEKKMWRGRNSDHIKLFYRAWQKSNPDRVSAISARYRSRKNKAQPDWLTEEDNRNITAIYSMSKRLSCCLGIPHEVDHIIPLNGAGVCGLHVPWNLAAIPAPINRSKSNKY